MTNWQIAFFVFMIHCLYDQGTIAKIDK